MGAVINLAEYKAKKDSEKQAEEGVKRDMQDSLDNDKVKRKYGIKTAPITTEQRMENIRKSIKRVNELMGQLKEMNKGGTNEPV